MNNNEDEDDEISAIDKIIALAGYIETTVQEAFGAEILNEWEQEFVVEMMDRITNMHELYKDTGSGIPKDTDCFSEKQLEIIDTIWNKADQPEV